MSKKQYELFTYTVKLLRFIRILFKIPRIYYFISRHLLQKILFKKETKFNKFIRYGFTLTGGGMIRPEDYRAMGTQITQMIKYLDNATKTEKLKKPVVWAEWVFSMEILRAFDIVIYVPETPCVISSIKGSEYSVKVFEEAESAGIPIEYCSSAKSAIGAYMLNEAPQPDLIITSSHPCDTNVSSYQTIEYMTKAPMFVMDTPYWDDEESYKYYEKNMWSMIRFLEKHLNQKMDWDKLKKICEIANTTNYYLQETSEISRAIPSPVTVQPLIWAWLGRICGFGTQEVADCAKIFYENAKARLDRGMGYISKEKIRVIWWDVPVAFSVIISWLEKEFGAIIVADYIGRVQSRQIDTSSERSMIRDLAIVHLDVAMARQCRGPIEFTTDEFERIIEEYSGDCFIFTRHNGCKHNWASIKIIKDICKKAGLPSLFMSMDIFDKRNLSEEEIKKQITEFFRSNGLA